MHALGDLGPWFGDIQDRPLTLAQEKGRCEYHTIRERLKSGIPLSPAVVDELKQLAGALNLSDRLE